MTKKNIEPWVTYLEHDVLQKDVPGVGRMAELKISVRPHEIFCVMKARSAEGYVVAFTGAGTLRGLTEKIRQTVSGGRGTWRPDRY